MGSCGTRSMLVRAGWKGYRGNAARTHIYRNRNGVACYFQSEKENGARHVQGDIHAPSPEDEYGSWILAKLVQGKGRVQTTANTTPFFFLVGEAE
ncbi:hypothetical protein LWI28_020496 [Acer negundo]|uniref:Uncharacterized protein n=1 Tax=Acer negundo TaxID=4023 RepID=A0AAD5JIE8_ACENE|nr:hypothetical protein LWI28_020496 [Acer negundo]